ncbi:hypothetical protein LA908_001396 [Salmonella enterica]|nr:hypothetical protein [Salmonella enterica]
MLKFVIYGDTVKNLNKTFTCKYAVIRRDDMTVIAEMDFFPDCNRSLMYRDGRYVRFLPLLQNDIMGGDTLINELTIRAGYRSLIMCQNGGVNALI